LTETKFQTISVLMIHAIRVIQTTGFVHAAEGTHGQRAEIMTMIQRKSVVIPANGEGALNMINPFFYANIWHGGDNKIVGEIIPMSRYQQLIKMGYTLWSFTGRKATVCVVTNDRQVTRLIALDFASMFMKGSYVTISVDLKNLTSTTTVGSPPP